MVIPADEGHEMIARSERIVDHRSLDLCASAGLDLERSVPPLEVMGDLGISRIRQWGLRAAPACRDPGHGRTSWRACSRSRTGRSRNGRRRSEPRPRRGRAQTRAVARRERKRSARAGRRPDPSRVPGCRSGQAATRPRRPVRGQGGSARSCRASAGRRVSSNERARSNRNGRTGCGSGGLSLGIELEEPLERLDGPGGIVQLGAGRPEDQQTASFPPWLSYQSLGRFLGRVFPVILQVKLSQRFERLRVIGVREPRLSRRS